MRSRRGINYRNDLDVDLSMDITKHRYPAVSTPPWFRNPLLTKRYIYIGEYQGTGRTGVDQ